ncbi:hypothetical protein N657DRAFT_576661 [Parathielavia appendiculata]|uniref:Rhodopsin domain-containing protein n=1 Tax=Parathielavia appendiculata TaxID=2587402 RepID=A0AAN6Z1X3_9PEZI|nr:hypothetical protein N657DRAFT_576661 [Parathielavia appendiculata]
MSSSTTAPDPAARGTPTGNDTDLVPFPGIPISERAAYLSQVYIGVTSALMFLCVIAFGTRIYQRIRPVWKVGLDDYFIAAGFILTIADWAMLFPMMVPPHPGLIPLSQSTEAGKSSWLAIAVWGLSMTCIKISIALTLLRIQGKERGWRIFLYTLMAVQAVYGVGNTLFNLVIACRPLQAAWNPFLPGATCVSVEVMRTVSNVGSAVNITTDVLLSLAPATFLRKLNRPLRERVFVCVLMGMGLFASVSSIVKTVIVQGWGDPTMSLDDWWAVGVSICTWTVLEQVLSVLAACVPAMKGIFQKCLGAMGFHLTQNKSQQRSGYYVRDGGTGAGISRTGSEPTAAWRSQVQAFRDDQRFSRQGKAMYGDEVCIDLQLISREPSTKSSGGRSLDHERSDTGGLSIEQLPTHAV